MASNSVWHIPMLWTPRKQDLELIEQNSCGASWRTGQKTGTVMRKLHTSCWQEQAMPNCLTSRVLL
jgi:hypothetical protein